MQAWDTQTYKTRLLAALQLYEQKALQRGGVHPQRVVDIRYLRQCILSIYDTALLESEIQAYLAKMPTRTNWHIYFWGGVNYSELKGMLEVVMVDEQARTTHLNQLESDYYLFQQLLQTQRSQGVSSVASADTRDVGKYQKSNYYGRGSASEEAQANNAITWPNIA